MNSRILARSWYYLKLPFKRMAYELLDQLVIQFIPRANSGGCLIFRLDLLGDYLMCRPFFASLPKDQPFGETHFVFAGNQMLQDLAPGLDSEVFGEFIWIDRSRFINSISYRFQILAGIRRRGFSTLINPMHTRQYWLESVVRVSGAQRRIGASATGEYMNPMEKALSDSWYSSFIHTGEEPAFEFFRNRSFFAGIAPTATRFHEIREKKFYGQEKQKLILLAPGASTEERRWPSPNFSELLKKLTAEFPGFRFGLIGSASEESLCQTIASSAGIENAENYAGKLRIVESLNLLSTASLLIANESGSVHLAATAGTACVCISNGNHFGRWNPYPEILASSVLTCYPESFYPLDEKYPLLLNAYHLRSPLPASLVENERVLLACRQLLRSWL
jgi:ADP-heptose:LPS heptosyltransferase